jgi:hypothetical protein
LVKPGSDIWTLTNSDKGAFHNLTKMMRLYFGEALMMLRKIILRKG